MPSDRLAHVEVPREPAAGVGSIQARERRRALWLPGLLTLALAGCGADTGRGTGPQIESDLAMTVRDLSASAPRDLAAPPDLSIAPDFSGCAEVCAGDKPLCDPVNHRCVACLADPDCPDAQVCKSGRCQPGCSARHAACGDAGSCDVDLGTCRGCLGSYECTDPQAPRCDRPSGRCVPCLLNDDACPLGFYCRLGGGGLPECTAGCKSDLDCFQAGDAGAHTACCAHRCVDTWSALDNCGGCGAACNLGACCSGLCVDPRSDVQNCGGCNLACPVKNNIPQCRNGMCGNLGCAPGFADCDGQPGNGCEVDITSDAKNCGGCGAMCALPNASVACVASKCAIAACLPGFLDCDARPDNGCEVNGAIDVKNCGGCGNSCANVVHGTPGCGNSRCNVLSCDPGWGDCNKLAFDGCEAQLAVDPNNCGGCQMKCSAPPNVQPTCAASTCGIGGCLPGFADCNHNLLGDGCEVNTQTDAKNCNGCGLACAPGQICRLGLCVSGDFGAGGDGALTVAKNGSATINSTRTTASGAAGQTTLTVGSTAGFAGGQNVLIHQSQGAGAGTWELASVAAVGNGALTLVLPLVGSYSTAKGDHAQVLVVPQYTDVTVNGGGTLTADAWDGSTGGILVLQASGTATLTGTVTMVGKGYRGASHKCTYQCTDGTAGESSLGLGVKGPAANGSGGGGGGKGQDCGEGGGGGYGAAGNKGDNGTGGTCSDQGHPGGKGGGTIGGQDLVASIFFGGAGGEGGGDEDGASPGPGGNGGGIVIIAAQTLTITGKITADGAKGGDGDSNSCGAVGCGMAGGGGGAGGAVRLVSGNATLGTKLVTAAAGAGGACTCQGSNAAAGGVGRIAVKAPMVTGTTTPDYFGG